MIFEGAQLDTVKRFKMKRCVKRAILMWSIWRFGDSDWTFDNFVELTTLKASIHQGTFAA
jgi:hypothetical protein